MNSQPTGGQVKRRTVVKGAAWSVPAIAVMGATPAFASSLNVTITTTGTACKLPGASCKTQTGVTKGYLIGVKLCATGLTGNVVITFDQTLLEVKLNGVVSTGWTINPNPLTVTGGACRTVTLAIQGEPNSQNVSISGKGPFKWSAQNGAYTGTGEMTFAAPSTPPCDDCKLPANMALAAKTAEAEVLADDSAIQPTEPEATSSQPAEPEATSSQLAEAEAQPEL
ncbi:MAG: hypothetical protein Q4P15_12485 [Propionibacteriaceae bacterium]|nr:hypothetical protein [Propionibacteriaceae bacterium]